MFLPGWDAPVHPRLLPPGAACTMSRLHRRTRRSQVVGAERLADDDEVLHHGTNARDGSSYNTSSSGGQSPFMTTQLMLPIYSPNSLNTRHKVLSALCVASLDTSTVATPRVEKEEDDDCEEVIRQPGLAQRQPQHSEDFVVIVGSSNYLTLRRFGFDHRNDNNNSSKCTVPYDCTRDAGQRCISLSTPINRLFLAAVPHDRNRFISCQDVVGNCFTHNMDTLSTIDTFKAPALGGSPPSTTAPFRNGSALHLNSVTALDVNPYDCGLSLLAVGCVDGSVSLFDARTRSVDCIGRWPSTFNDPFLPVATTTRSSSSTMMAMQAHMVQPVVSLAFCGNGTALVCGGMELNQSAVALLDVRKVPPPTSTTINNTSNKRPRSSSFSSSKARSLQPGVVSMSPVVVAHWSSSNGDGGSRTSTKSATAVRGSGMGRHHNVVGNWVADLCRVDAAPSMYARTTGSYSSCETFALASSIGTTGLFTIQDLQSGRPIRCDAAPPPRSATMQWAGDSQTSGSRGKPSLHASVISTTRIEQHLRKKENKRSSRDCSDDVWALRTHVVALTTCYGNGNTARGGGELRTDFFSESGGEYLHHVITSTDAASEIGGSAMVDCTVALPRNCGLGSSSFVDALCVMNGTNDLSYWRLQL